MAPNPLFLSCVSAELGSYRDGLGHKHDVPDVAVKIQRDFSAGGRLLRRGESALLAELVETVAVGLHQDYWLDN
jgi:hypothetical protein